MQVNIIKGKDKATVKAKPLSLEYNADGGRKAMKVIIFGFGEYEIFKNLKTNAWEHRITKSKLNSKIKIK